MRVFIVMTAAVILCGCGRPGQQVPLTFPPTPVIQADSGSDAYRAALVADRDAFILAVSSRREEFAAQARTMRTKAFRYTLWGSVVGASGTVIPAFITKERHKSAVAQTASGASGIITALVGFHSHNERARNLELCVARINTGVVAFSTRWANPTTILSVGDTLWRQYSDEKARIVADIQGVCPVTGRSIR